MPLILINNSVVGGGSPTLPPQFVTVYGSNGLNPNPPAESTLLNDAGWRIRVPATAMGSIPAGSSKIKLSFNSGISGGTEGLSIANCYVGHAAPSGNAWDTTSMTAVTFSSGSAGFSIATNTEITSDEITFAYDGTSDLIVSVYFNSSGADHVGRHNGSTAGATTIYNKTNSDSTETDDLTPSGFSTLAADTVRLLSRVQLYGTPTEFFPLFKQVEALALENVNSGNTRTFRTRIPFKFLENILATPTRVKVRIGASTTGTEGCTVAKVYIGHAAGSGDAYDAADLTQLLFSGSPGVAMAVGATALSDEVAWAYDGVSDIIITAYMNDADHDRVGEGSFDGMTAYMSNTGTDEAATLNATTGYAAQSSRLAMIKQIYIAEAPL